MKKSTEIFHALSYLQYPLMLTALYFVIQPYFNGFDNPFPAMNKGLVFIGLGISFSTLQDTSKTQNKLSLRIYQNPIYARIFIITMITLILFFIIAGLTGMFAASESRVSEVSFGMVVCGIGLIGMLKAIMEMAEKHKDKKT